MHFLVLKEEDPKNGKKSLPLCQHTRPLSPGYRCQNRNPVVNQQLFNEHICSIQFGYLLSSHFVQSRDRGCRDVNLKQIESQPPEVHEDEKNGHAGN